MSAAAKWLRHDSQLLPSIEQSTCRSVQAKMGLKSLGTRRFAPFIQAFEKALYNFLVTGYWFRLPGRVLLG